MKGIYNKNNRTKRYVLLFAEWWREPGEKSYQVGIWKESISWHEYDDIKEVNEEINVIKEVYKDQPFRTSESNDYTNRDYGYAVLDYKVEKIILSGFKGFKGLTIKDNKNLKILDEYFRGPEEIPKDYKWDNGEYEGWLQFRWGNGKNAINYKPEPKKKTPENLTYEYDDEWKYDPEDEYRRLNKRNK